MKKKLVKIMSSLALIALITGCGGNNSSGGDRNNNPPPSTNNNNLIGAGQTGIGSGVQTFNSIEELRAAFASKPLNDGLSNGESVYHVGSYFGGSSGGGAQVSAQIYGCINLIFWQAGNCSQNNTQYIDNQLSSALNLGRWWSISSANTSGISINEAYDVNNGQYLFQAKNFDRSNLIYQEMLGLDLTAPQVKLSNAKIILTNNTTIEGVYVEYFSNASSYGGLVSAQKIASYVLSTNLPVVANPIVSLNGSNNIDGYLSHLGGNIQIAKIELQRVHSLSINYFNGGSSIVDIGSRTIYIRNSF